MCYGMQVFCISMIIVLYHEQKKKKKHEWSILNKS